MVFSLSASKTRYTPGCIGSGSGCPAVALFLTGCGVKSSDEQNNKYSPVPGILRRRLAGEMRHGLSLAEFAVRREGKLLLAMVGLPARGKTYIAQSIKRHMVRRTKFARRWSVTHSVRLAAYVLVQYCLYCVWFDGRHS